MTLIEAIALVVLVMYVFLQNWRATLIPAIAVPVVLLGTFGVLAVAHYSINTLTLFALVLVIGLLVDDAIVVVENVERIMHDEGLSPRDATLKSMEEITGALIGIGLVLTAVFLPMAFFGGSTGVIYRQFSITIVSAMTLSIMVALVLSPSLCATLLKPVPEGQKHQQGAFFRWFNRNFDAFRDWYQERVVLVPAPHLADHDRLWRGDRGRGLLFTVLPTGFLPDEDQGFIFNLITLARRLDPARNAEGRARCREILSRQREEQCRLRLHRGRLLLRRLGREYRHGLHPPEGLERALRRQEHVGRPSPAAPSWPSSCARTRRSMPSCRPACRNWATPPASTWKWKTAATWAMPA